MELIRYDAAIAAVAAAKTADEAKNIRDVAVAMAAYARQAKNRDLEADALEIRMRATRRLDQLRRKQKETVGLNEGGRPSKTGSKSDPVSERPTLAEQGIDKHLAHEARQLGALDDEEFEEVLSEARDEISRVIKKVINAESKADRRAAREVELGTRQRAMPTKRYGIILADPPWRFEPYSRETGMDRAADNHYPTMTVPDVAALKVPAADDAVLFLWVTVPFDAMAHEILRAWDFTYASQFVWVKPRAGTGYWSRNRHEMLFVAVRGSPPAPAPGTQFESVIESPQGRHSEKPERAYEIIESYFPTLPKLEMFARKVRPGWDAWGNEIETAA